MAEEIVVKEEVKECVTWSVTTDGCRTEIELDGDEVFIRKDCSVTLVMSLAVFAALVERFYNHLQLGGDK
jgi:hypothetical protein